MNYFNSIFLFDNDRCTNVYEDDDDEFVRHII